MSAAAFRDLDPATLRAPWSLYESWRAQGAVVYVPELGGHVVTRHALATRVLRAPLLWSSDTIEGPTAAAHAGWTEELVVEEPALRELLEVPQQTLLALDPPAHGRLRKVLVEHLSAARVGRLTPAIDAHVADLVPALLTGAEVDAVAAFTAPLPLRMVGTLLGLPALEEWRALAVVASTSNPHLETKATLRARLLAELGLLRRFEALLAAPPSALTQGLADAVAAGTLTSREAAGLCREILVAGSETTGDLLASLLLVLSRDPALLRADMEVVVEEVMRLESPFPGFWRRAAEDTTLDGVDLPAGTLLLVPFGALNRDPEMFPAPDELRLDREQPRRHLAFGNGIHFCVGAPLARLQIGRALHGLLPRVRRIELLTGEDDLRYRPSVQARGLAALPLRLS